MPDYIVNDDLDKEITSSSETIKSGIEELINKNTENSLSIQKAINLWSNNDKDLKYFIENNIDEAQRIVNAERDLEVYALKETLAQFGIGDYRKRDEKGDREYLIDIHNFLKSVRNQVKSGNVDASNLTLPGGGNLDLDVMGRMYGNFLRGGIEESSYEEYPEDYAQKLFEKISEQKPLARGFSKTSEEVKNFVVGMYQQQSNSDLIDPSELSPEEQSLIDTYDIGYRRRSKNQNVINWFEETLDYLKSNKESDFSEALPQITDEDLLYFQDVVAELKNQQTENKPDINSFFQEASQRPEQEDISRNLEASLGIALPPKEPPKPPTAVSPGDDEEGDDPLWAAFREQQERNRETSRKRAAEFNKLFESTSSNEDSEIQSVSETQKDYSQDPGIQYIPGTEINYTEDPGIQYLDPPEIKYIDSTGTQYVEDPAIKFLEKNLKSLNETSNNAAESIEAVNDVFTDASKVVDDASEVIEAKLVGRFIDKNQPSVEGIEPVNEPFTAKDLVPKAMEKKEDEEEDPIIAGVKNILRGTGRTGSKIAQVMDAYSSIKKLMGGAGAGGVGGGGGGGVAAAAGGAAGGGGAGMVPMLATGAVIAPLVMEAIKYQIETTKKFVTNRIDFAKDLTVGSISDPSSVDPLDVSGEYFKTVADAIDFAGPLGSLVSEPLRQAVDFLSSIDGGIKNLASNLAPFSPDIIVADIEGQIARLQADMEQAQQLGPLLADNVRARTEFELAIKDLGTTLTELFGPLLNDLIDLATLMVKSLDIVINLLSGFGQTALEVVANSGSRMAPIAQLILAYLYNIQSNTEPKRTNYELTELEDFLNPNNVPLQGNYRASSNVVPGTLGVTF